MGAVRVGNGVFGDAIRISNPNQYLEAVSANTLNFDTGDKFSMLIWFRTSGIAFFSFVGNFDNNDTGSSSTSSGINVGYGNDKFYVELISNFSDDDWFNSFSNDDQLTGNVIQDNKWHQFGFTYDGSGDALGVKYYLDGQPIPSFTSTNSLSGSILTSKKFRINNTPIQQSVVDYDNFRAYDVELTANQINTLYPNGGISQIECSKRCLPRLWRWYPVFAEVGGAPKSFRGYMQSNELIQYKNQDEVPLFYCPPETCVLDRDLGENPTLNRCTGCSGCEVVYNEENPIETAYVCEKCEQCLLDIPGDDGPDSTKTLTCTNFNSCTSCKQKKTNLGVPLYDVYENECNACNFPDNPSEGGCVFHTRDPYIQDPIAGTIELRPEVQLYNSGINYNPYSRENGCDLIPFTQDNCGNNSSNGDVGFTDGVDGGRATNC